MKRHESQRGYFAYELHKQMQQNRDIWLLCGDLGFGMFDEHFRDYTDRCINTGAAEHTMMCMAVGLAMEGKIPFCYSITPFLIYRPFEVLRNYVNHEKLNVKLIASGRDEEYEDDGFSHHSEEAKKVMDIFGNIRKYWPDNKKNVPHLVRKMVEEKGPAVISLRRKDVEQTTVIR